MYREIADIIVDTGRLSMAGIVNRILQDVNSSCSGCAGLSNPA